MSLFDWLGGEATAGKASREAKKQLKKYKREAERIRRRKAEKNKKEEEEKARKKEEHARALLNALSKRVG